MNGQDTSNANVCWTVVERQEPSWRARLEQARNPAGRRDLRRPARLEGACQLFGRHAKRTAGSTLRGLRQATPSAARPTRQERGWVVDARRLRPSPQKRRRRPRRGWRLTVAACRGCASVKRATPLAAPRRRLRWQPDDGRSRIRLRKRAAALEPNGARGKRSSEGKFTRLSDRRPSSKPLFPDGADLPRLTITLEASCL